MLPQLPSLAQVRVRYAETDQMGVVHHANYFVWFEIGRVELLRDLGFDYKQMEIEDDCHLPVVEATCRYRASARYDDEIVIETRVTGMRSFLLKFGYRVLRAQDSLLLAEGETSHVVCDHTMTKRPLAEKYRQAIRQVYGVSTKRSHPGEGLPTRGDVSLRNAARSES